MLHSIKIQFMVRLLFMTHQDEFWLVVYLYDVDMFRCVIETCSDARVYTLYRECFIIEHSCRKYNYILYEYILLIINLYAALYKNTIHVEVTFYDSSGHFLWLIRTISDWLINVLEQICRRTRTHIILLHTYTHIIYSHVRAHIPKKL